MRHLSHSTYYRDRLTERDLCHDFPGDEILIDGLHAMQTHMWNNGVNIDIPILQVMNSAHFLAAYMFATTCSGDQMEYDALADISVGRDKQMFRVTMIVLAAMLKRTEGFRAKQCRNMLLENRDPDFEEGVTLYDRFLRSSEERFAEEDFLIDTHQQIQKLIAENEQLRHDKQQLEIRYRLMENQHNNQYNNCVIYNAPVYNTSNTTNNYYPQNIDVENNTACSEKDQASTTKNSQNNAADYMDILPIPRKGKYTEVRRYIEERCKFDDEFKTFVETHSRVELCMRLTDEFGWDVDDHHLGVNMNRNR